MRAGPVAVAAMVLALGACTGGDGDGFGPPTTAPATTSTSPPATTSTLPATTVPTTVPTGAVTLRVTGLTLPDVRAGGTGLRLLVRSTSPRLIVRRRGGGGAVAACPVAGPTAAVAPGDCLDLGPGATVEPAFVGGVELRATGAAATVEEVAVTYLPAARTTTLVTPARPAGACEASPCEATFSFLPGGAGAFRLDGQGAGGRPRLVLTSVTPSSNRMLATVEGGGSLSIRATLEVGSEARLLHQEQGPNAVAPVTAEISWP